MRQEIIRIENLKCGGCANSIKNGLSKMDGVDSIDVNMENSEVTINYTSELERTDFVAKLRKMGYPEPGESNLGITAKSYVSCAIGRLSNSAEQV